MQQFILYLGFFIAVYSVIGNDVIQTLGTFLSSNAKKKWWLLWGFAATILCLTILYGWYLNHGDVSYGRLDSIPLPENVPFWYLMAPLALFIITRYGIPVSTTFMILSVFSDQQVIGKMILKSVFGYAIAFVSSFLLYFLIAKWLESESSIKKMHLKKQKKYWLAAQWCSTAFLWSQWLIQDFANIFVFLPRKLDLFQLLIALAVILLIMVYIFKNKGGKIQRIVNQKVNTQNIRSATFIDVSYGLLLYFYGNLNTIPMSTTWTFIGVLAGRELAINYRLRKKDLKKSYKLIVKDLAKVNIGLVVSITIAYVIQLLKGG